jgi:hypothetical protein
MFDVHVPTIEHMFSARSRVAYLWKMRLRDMAHSWSLVLPASRLLERSAITCGSAGWVPVSRHRVYNMMGTLYHWHCSGTADTEIATSYGLLSNR